MNHTILDSIVRQYTAPWWRSTAVKFAPRDVEHFWPTTICTIRAAYKRATT